VFVVGDGAAAQGAGLAQGAIAHGSYVGKKIAAVIKGKVLAPYKGKTIGYLVPIGHHWAVFTYKKWVMTGLIPWLMRSFVDFKYFTSIVSWQYVLEVFRLGEKYRKEY
jgi:NADH dehydrogenase FAD-containing subunit